MYSFTKGIFFLTVFAANQSVLAANARSIECSCLKDSNGSKELCYGYVLSIGAKEIEFYEGETGGSGRYKLRRSRNFDSYSARIKTGTGQKIQIYALKKHNGLTRIYTDRISKSNLSFIAMCK